METNNSNSDDERRAARVLRAARMRLYTYCVFAVICSVWIGCIVGFWFNGMSWPFAFTLILLTVLPLSTSVANICLTIRRVNEAEEDLRHAARVKSLRELFGKDAIREENSKSE